MSFKPIPNRIFVGGLKEFIKQEDLYNYFSTFGNVKDVKIIQDHSNVPKGNYGFVTFFENGIVEKILSRDAETLKIKDRKININYAVKRSNDSYDLKEEDILKTFKESSHFDTGINRLVDDFSDCCKNNFCFDCLREIRGIHENIDSLKNQVNILIQVIKSMPIVQNYPDKSQHNVWKSDSWLKKNQELLSGVNFHNNTNLNKLSDLNNNYNLTLNEDYSRIENSRINEKYQSEILSLRNESELFNAFENILISSDQYAPVPSTSSVSSQRNASGDVNNNNKNFREI